MALERLGTGVSSFGCIGRIWTILPFAWIKAIESGIEASFIQNETRCGAGKTKSMPAFSASVCRNRKPFVCSAAVSANSTSNVSFPIWIWAVRNPFSSSPADGVAGLEGVVDLKGVLRVNGVTEGAEAVKGVMETLGVGVVKGV